ncbi:tRNA (guanine(46)-N(7))-methyltransferase TrmB [Azospirillum thermophilum]|uniref:tRNA (guanine-N(7)-)-methyltransferase n=1 Tax=Azospirillum thermophilum TaxID=2202148 RepID=A0A2S2CP87_9PROT|nr:tRNA (guanine(46)-N(7))-methyltransferase TrmB [Azospirillum thermophilum]AWK86137.1 tRNA (guanosine(46)-N7)-methyltransferase TrmB [Azospirillum thermophilum]
MTDDHSGSATSSSGRLYGRRKGRPLRKYKSSLIDTLLPSIALPVPGPGDRIDQPAALFGRPVRDVWLEVGFGSGHHLAWQAEHNPDIGLIGAEPFVNGVAGLLAMVEKAGLQDTVRVLPDDARPLLDALPDASIGRAFVLFADPWPKKRHWERRFIGPENLPRLARVLKDGAELRLASDDMGLVRWMLEHTVKDPNFEWTARGPSDWRVRPSDWPPTRYEEKAIAAGRKPVFLRFVRKAR